MVSEDLRSHSLPLCRNIEEFPYKLWLCPRPYSLSSGVDNVHRCLPGFIIHFHHCNLRIFPLQGLQQQLIVLSPGQMHFSILCIIHDIISEIEFLLADIMWRRRVLVMVLVWRTWGGRSVKKKGRWAVWFQILTNIRTSVGWCRKPAVSVNYGGPFTRYKSFTSFLFYQFDF